MRDRASNLSGRRAALLVALLALVATVSVASCGADTRASSAGTIAVVAGENFWGSIAAQLGGDRVEVTSIVSDPDADPHEYESSTSDARLFADAGYVVLNGAGYDDWGRKLLDANPSSGRLVLDVADTIGKKAGDNPHLWYDPAYVAQVAAHITADYKRLRPAEAGYFAEHKKAFDTALSAYRALIADIGARFHGRRVAATEDIFVYLAAALNLELVSPPEFMQAVAEGNDPPAQAVAQFTDQLQNREVAVLVYNNQTVTAVTTAMKSLAQSRHVPVVGISETLQPPKASFQQWQEAQLAALRDALAQSTSG